MASYIVLPKTSPAVESLPTHIATESKGSVTCGESRNKLWGTLNDESIVTKKVIFV